MMVYLWNYLSKTEPRGSILYEVLKPLLKEGDRILDVDCGYSPMAKHLIEDYTVTGFDTALEPIEYLKRTHPKGEWLQLDDAEAKMQGYNVLLLFGITTPLISAYSETYLDSVKRLIDLNKPRVIMIESADAADQSLYDQVTRHIGDLGRYKIEKMGKYDAEMEDASIRHYATYTQAWDYELWGSRFRGVKTIDEMNRMHEWLYQVAGINIGPLSIMVSGKPAKPSLPALKDRILFKMIEDKFSARPVLIIGFWNGRFAYNLGLDGFKVDALEPYERAVIVANKTRDTLPEDLKRRFNFKWGMAENLGEYGLYDITVSFCLEHVRDPKMVMEENLRHLKHRGCAYFTPPIKHGTDSPEHLQHYTRGDLLGLIPEGYTTEINEVKFDDKAPYENCFILRVRNEN